MEFHTELMRAADIYTSICLVTGSNAALTAEVTAVGTDTMSNVTMDYEVEK